MRWAVAAAVSVLAAVAWWASVDPPAPVAVSDEPPVSEAPGAAPSVARQVEARVVASPVSLRGAELDGEVAWLPDGSVRIDLALRRRFDHLLSALGEVSLAQVRSRLLSELTPVTTAERVAAVMTVFDRYVAYLEAVTRLQPEADARQRLQQAHDLRIERLGAETARAFFEDEERADAWSIARRELLTRGEATPEKLAELDALLPPEARAVVKEAAELRDTVDDTARFDAEGVSAEERRRLREAKVGAEAALRLGALDAERAKWNERVEALKARRRTLDEAQLEAVLERDFSEAERRRVRALLAE